MADIALGIDIGSSGVRIAAVDRSNALLAIAAAPIIAPLQNTGRHLQDPAQWWRACETALDELDRAGHKVLAIAVDGTSGTILPIDTDGAPTDLASMYNDVADQADLAALAAVAPPDTAALGGTSPLARALRMGVRGGRIVHQADWIAGQFSGRFDTTDENNALKTGYDPIARSWPDWIAKTGFDMARLPRVVPAGSPVGTILPAIADRFGLSGDAVIVAGTTDGCAAFLASGADAPGDGVTSLGTTLTVKLLSHRPVFSPEHGIYSHRIGDQWLAGGASNVGGAVIRQFFTEDDVARLTNLLEPDRPTGLDYYPLPRPGERFPISDPALPPRLTPRPESDRAFFQAILEGIGAVEALAYRRLGELGASPLVSIRTVGGGATNQAWTAIRERLLGVPAKPAHSHHAAVGTASLAWRGLGA